MTVSPPTAGVLLDRAAIHDIITGYCRALDQRRYDEALRSFAADAVIDFGPGRLYDGPASFQERLQTGVLMRLDATWHGLSQIEIDVDGDVASSTSYVAAGHFSSTEGDSWVYGKYVDRFVRATDGWKVTARRLETMRVTGFFGRAAWNQAGRA